VGSGQTVTRQIKLEAHLLLGLGARFQILSTQSSILDGNCRILIGNNEGNRKNNAKTKKQLPTQKSMGYRLDFKISLLKMQPETHVFSKFAAPADAYSTEKT